MGLSSARSSASPLPTLRVGPHPNLWVVTKYPPSWPRFFSRPPQGPAYFLSTRPRPHLPDSHGYTRHGSPRQHHSRTPACDLSFVPLACEQRLADFRSMGPCSVPRSPMLPRKVRECLFLKASYGNVKTQKPQTPPVPPTIIRMPIESISFPLGLLPRCHGNRCRSLALRGDSPAALNLRGTIS